jgi:poly(3-hydroxybutyrate) depolymerase
VSRFHRWHRTLLFAVGLSLLTAAAPTRPPLALTATSSPAFTERTVRFVDTTRSTVSHGRLLSRSRTLPTLLLQPASPGPHPLVVFCHGYDITPTPYLHLLRRWAKAGFLVAAPSFPLTSSAAGRWLDESDIVHQPQDAAFVLTQTEKVLGAAVDRARVIVAGHSDGGATSFGAGYAVSLRDPRWTAVMVFSGDRRRSMGTFSAPARTLPFLQIQSDRDELNSLQDAAEVWSVPRAPKAYLHLYGARHLPPFATANAYRDVVEAVTTAFLHTWTTASSANRIAWHKRMDDEAVRRGLSSITDVR